MSSYVCQFCNKIYNTISSLNHHQKTAKFCLDIRNSESKIVYTCEYCDKQFTVKNAFLTHQNSCNEKIIFDRINKVINNHTNEINSLNQLHTNEILLLNQKIDFYIQIIKEKDQIIKEKEDLIKELVSKDNNNITNIYQSINNSNNNYSIQFNNCLEKLVPFTQENIKARIENINYRDIVNKPNSSVVNNFVYEFTNSMKDMAFTTDPSRNKIVIKKETGEYDKIQSEKFISDCIDPNKVIIGNLCDRSCNYATEREASQTFNDKEFGQTIQDLTFIKCSINNGKSGDLTKKMSNQLNRIIPSISYKKNQLLEVTT
jgi:hypothetical protein